MGWGQNSTPITPQRGSILHAGSHLGISAEPRPDHASYIAHYLTLMRSDKKAIFTAAAKAAEATDYLWNFSHPKEPSPTNESDDHER